MLDRWIKCTGGDFRYIREVVDHDSEDTEEDMTHWFNVYDQFIDGYGLSKHYLKVLQTMKKLALLEVKYGLSVALNNPDRFLETLIEIEEQKLKSLMTDNGKGMSIEESLPSLSKSQGYPIRAHETTFIEYQNILDSYGRASKKK